MVGHWNLLKIKRLKSEKWRKNIKGEKALKSLKIQLKKKKAEVKLLEEEILQKRLKKKISKALHSLEYDSIGRKHEVKYYALCGAKLKKTKREVDVFHEGYSNATYLEDDVDCPHCLANMRFNCDTKECPECGIGFDTTQETYCGGCAKKTRKKRRLLPPNEIYLK